MPYSKEQIEERFKAVLDPEDYMPSDIEITAVPLTTKGKRGWDITVSAMYSAPNTKAKSLVHLLQDIQEATGLEHVDIVDEHSRRGCDTCDYGSSYGKTYRVWSE